MSTDIRTTMSHRQHSRFSTAQSFMLFYIVWTVLLTLVVQQNDKKGKSNINYHTPKKIVGKIVCTKIAKSLRKLKQPMAFFRSRSKVQQVVREVSLLYIKHNSIRFGTSRDPATTNHRYL